MTISNTYPAKFIRLAQACQAEHDVRYYLNGIMLYSSGLIIGTDGHRMAISDSQVKYDFESFRDGFYDAGSSDDPGVIVHLTAKVPGTADIVQFDFEVMIARCIRVLKSGDIKEIKTIPFTMIEGRYPDWRRAVPQSDPKPMQPYVNAEYLAAAAVFNDGVNYCAVTLEAHGDERWPSVKIVPSSGWNTSYMYVMGMRR